MRLQQPLRLDAPAAQNRCRGTIAAILSVSASAAVLSISRSAAHFSRLELRLLDDREIFSEVVGVLAFSVSSALSSGSDALPTRVRLVLRGSDLPAIGSEKIFSRHRHRPLPIRLPLRFGALAIRRSVLPLSTGACRYFASDSPGSTMTSAGASDSSVDSRQARTGFACASVCRCDRRLRVLVLGKPVTPRPAPARAAAPAVALKAPSHPRAASPAQAISWLGVLPAASSFARTAHQRGGFVHISGSVSSGARSRRSRRCSGRVARCGFRR